MIKVGKRIKKLRESLGLNQKEFSALIDVVQASLSGYENDLKQPSLNVLMRISKQFNVSLDWLCSNTTTNHFVTGADIIDLFMELQTIPGFDYDIMVSDDDPNTVNLKFKGKHDSSDMVFGSGEFVQFFREMAEIYEKYKTSNDPEFVKDYLRMWLKEKKSYFASMGIKY